MSVKSAPIQSAGGAAAAMAPVTTVHLVLIAIAAVVAIVAICWGIRLKRQRKVAEAEMLARREAAGDAVTEVAPSGSVSDTPETPTPVTPPVEATPELALPAVAPVAPAIAPAPIPAPAVLALAPAVVEPAATPSDITRLKGLGPKLATRLAELGVTRIDQIAALSPADAEALDAQLGTFRGRITRDRWIEQATLLNAGDTAGYEAEFGRL